MFAVPAPTKTNLRDRFDYIKVINTLTEGSVTLISRNPTIEDKLKRHQENMFLTAVLAVVMGFSETAQRAIMYLAENEDVLDKLDATVKFEIAPNERARRIADIYTLTGGDIRKMVKAMYPWIHFSRVWNPTEKPLPDPREDEGYDFWSI